MIWQVSWKYNWKQANWGDKERNNVYKRGGGCNRKRLGGIKGKNLGKNKREKITWAEYRKVLFMLFCLLPVPRENSLYFLE